jgi:hypothetical protein
MKPHSKRWWWTSLNRHDLLAFLLLVLTGLAVYAVLITPLALRPYQIPLQVGQVAPQDFQAPRDTSYISDVRTNQARQAAESAVSDVYTSPDPAIARRQIEALRIATQTIQGIREDENALPSEKRASLSIVADVNLSSQAIEYLLNFPDTRWSAVQVESLGILERTMRNPVREETLETVRQSIPYLVSYTLAEDQNLVVVELVTPFVTPNSFYSEERTKAERERARQGQEPLLKTYVTGELVVQRGKLLTETDIEALQAMGLIRPRNLSVEYLGAAALVSVITAFIGMYFHRRRPAIYNEGRSLVLLAVLFIVFLAASRVIIPNRTLLPYLYPIPGFGLLVATLFGPGSALVLSIPLSILAAYNLPNSPSVSLYYLFASLVGILSLGKAQRISAFIWSALTAATAGVVIVIAYLLPAGELDPLGFLQLISAALVMGLGSSSLALILQYLLAEFLGLTTALRLVEISRPDAPLLQYFLRNAPGTYQHSLMVANLAEQAAEKLGMDTMLVRVGALYHDVGKAANPSFFIENQMLDNLDPHDDLAPDVAAATVIRHVTDGVALARKYRLPKRIQDFMLEHHGALIARYQYNKALQAAGGDPAQVEEEKFRYPGPRPRTRETALMMLADNVEARARSERPKTEADLRALVQKAIDYCQKENQLAETRFTIKDLTIIIDSFTTTLSGLYHPRISYPAGVPTETQPAEKTEKA